MIERFRKTDQVAPAAVVDVPTLVMFREQTGGGGTAAQGPLDSRHQGAESALSPAVLTGPYEIHALVSVFPEVRLFELLARGGNACEGLQRELP
jgi:hypothetical protein